MTKEITSEIGRFEVDEIYGLVQEGLSRETQAIEKLRVLRERILRGESTGDRIRDFIIVNSGTLSEEAEKPYRELEARVRNNFGEQVLIVWEEEGTTCGRIDSIDRTFQLGILESPLEFDYKKGIVFPMNRYVIKPYHIEAIFEKLKGGEWQLQKRGMVVSLDRLKFLDKRIMPRDIITGGITGVEGVDYRHFLGETQGGLQVYMGEEVEQYFRCYKFRDESSWGVLPMSELKEYMDVIREGMDENRRRNFDSKYLDLSYVNALRLLGREDLIPKDFQKA